MRWLFEDYLNPPLSFLANSEKDFALIQRGEPFARSENGDFLFWDIDNPNSQGEFPIYFTDFSSGVYFAGESLSDFISRVTSQTTFKSMLNFHQKPLKPTFEVFHELVW